MFTYDYVSNCLNASIRYRLLDISPVIQSTEFRILFDKFTAPLILYNPAILTNVDCNTFIISHLYAIGYNHYMRKIQKISILPCICLAVFITLTVGVLLKAKFIQQFDNFGQQLIQHYDHKHNWFFTAITSIGNVSWSAIILITISLWLIYHHFYRETLFIGFNVIVFAGLSNQIVKNIITRPRPTPHLVPTSGFSFPSGHAMVSVLLYGSLIIILHRHLKSNWQRRVASCLLLGLIILIPISRVYVNVHYPSDIVAGMAIAYTMLYISQQLFFNNKGVPDDSLK